VTASAAPSPRATTRPERPRRSPFAIVGLLVGLVFTLFCAAPPPIGIGVDIGDLAANLTRGERIIREMLHPNFAFFPQTVKPLIETFQMAVVACVLGCAIGLPLAFLASRVTTSGPWTLRVDRWMLNVIRAMPDLLYALVFVTAVGVGPLAGVLALLLFNIGVMAKLLSETVDAVDTGPVEAATAVGASRTQMVRSAVFPQVMPNYVAFSLYIFELNIRASTVIGIVGAGGIGNVLNTQMKFFNFDNVGLVVLELFVLVLLIELASVSLRRRLV
jgi:phosphonate transport system permease protein